MLGLAIGQIRVFGINCGIAGVLFSGLLFGHFKLQVNKEVLEFMRDFGLVLFVYTIGIQVGPALFASFRKEGIKLNILAASTVFLGILVTALIIAIAKVPIEVAVGVLSGAVTNTPGLGAAQQALREAFPAVEGIDKVPGLGYAVAYPFAIFGIIFTMLAFKRLFRVDLKKEAELFAERQRSSSGQPDHFKFVLSNPNAAGKTLSQISSLVDAPCAFSYILRNGSLVAPTQDARLEIGDQLEIVCSRQSREDFQFLLVGAASFEEQESVPLALHGLDFRQIFVTHPDACKSVAELDMTSRHSVSITKVERAGLELVAYSSLRLQFGDRVYAVGDPSGLDKVAAELGDSVKHLEHPNLLPIFLGIILGVFLGSLPVCLPGMPAPLKLGLAGGPLLVAIVLSRIRQIGRLSWFLPHSANIALREIGITFFLACVGLNSGGKFLETLTKGDGILWIFYGILITMIPILIVGLFSRIFLKMDYPSLCGLLSGSMTDPPALSFALQMGGGDAPSVAYASVYALTMFLRILTAQLLVIVYALLCAH